MLNIAIINIWQTAGDKLTIVCIDRANHWAMSSNLSADERRAQIEGLGQRWDNDVLHVRGLEWNYKGHKHSMVNW